jgi:hypothetical protein
MGEFRWLRLRHFVASHPSYRLELYFVISALVWIIFLPSTSLDSNRLMSVVVVALGFPEELGGTVWAVYLGLALLIYIWSLIAGGTRRRRLAMIMITGWYVFLAITLAMSGVHGAAAAINFLNAAVALFTLYDLSRP